MTKREYNWEAMARAITEGRSPRTLAETLRGLYEMGYRHGTGWCGDEDIADLVQSALSGGDDHG